MRVLEIRNERPCARVEPQGEFSVQLLDFGFWEEAWRKAGQTVLRSRRGKGLEGQADFWNQRAADFAGKVLPDSTRVQEVMDWLARQGVSLANSRVLDVGSGPGAFALPFAAAGAEVVALEPAAAMIAALQKNLEGTQLARRVRVVQDFWEEVDVKSRDWAGAFDLVFASMSPGINNWETIARVLACSRKYCYFSGFAGERFSSHYRRLWEILYNKKMPPWPSDIFFVNQLLVLKGYDVTFHLWNRRRPEALEAAKMTESFLEFFRLYGEEADSLEETIRAYVEAHLEEGAFRHEINTRLGKVLVKL
jgi:SAM-dependent methyltransferase